MKTMTFDNDHAFSLHHEIAKELNMKTFLQDPVHHRIKAVLKTEMMSSEDFMQRKRTLMK